MLCQKCGQRPATVHIVKQVNNHREEHHLCDVCAREHGQVAMEPAFGFPNFSLQQLLTGMLEPFHLAPVRGPAEGTCPGCGLTLSEFKASGFLGCAQCYQAFQGELASLVRRVQGSDRHTGKAPKRAGGLLRLKKELAQARQALQQAVAREEFERAAELRDRIRELEQRIKAGGEAGAVE